jgi:predicted RNase H-like nuclease (RuvC/YqgF family)
MDKQVINKTLSDQEIEDRFNFEHRMLDATAEWWSKEISKYMPRYDALNNTQCLDHEQESELRNLQQIIQHLVKKAEFEEKLATDLNSRYESFLFKRFIDKLGDKDRL